jgi:hypothetical protein
MRDVVIVRLICVYLSPWLFLEAVGHSPSLRTRPTTPLNISVMSRVVMTKVNARRFDITPQSWHNPLHRFADGLPHVQIAPAFRAF